MKIISTKGDFFCAVLEPHELGMFSNSKHLSYSDINDDVEHNQEDVIAAIDYHGPEYFAGVFNQDGQSAFVLMKDHQIFGSAEIVYDSEKKEAAFQAGHIYSELRGHDLSKLLYKAREAFVRAYYPNCEKLNMCTSLDNEASYNAARSNGFKFSHFDQYDNVHFEKTL